ncbi:Vacuolar cation-transporting ATPase YPK9 [Porphyridium purpureum]|uniref:Cation-transporting ATPase n=1 Tax=Porphyridium purpureum TaxID=35688 RepID=A0A5J4YYP4_PORPP|nr:Vacuolar cation-transporting ATPase YPK9 [Porphyridium purpureum]|eukprot:POR8854..scf209_3
MLGGHGRMMDKPSAPSNSETSPLLGIPIAPSAVPQAVGSAMDAKMSASMIPHAQFLHPPAARRASAAMPYGRMSGVMSDGDEDDIAARREMERGRKHFDIDFFTSGIPAGAKGNMAARRSVRDLDDLGDTDSLAHGEKEPQRSTTAGDTYYGATLGRADSSGRRQGISEQQHVGLMRTRLRKKKAKVRAEVDELVGVELFVRSKWRSFLFVLFCVMTLGIPYLIVRSRPRWLTLCTHRRASLEDDDLLVVVKTWRGSWLFAECETSAQASDLVKYVRLAQMRESNIISERFKSYHQIIKYTEKYGVDELRGCIFSVRYRRYMLVDLTPPHEYTTDDDEDADEIDLSFNSPWLLLPVACSLSLVVDTLFEVPSEDEELAQKDKSTDSDGDDLDQGEQTMRLRDDIELSPGEAMSRRVIFGKNLLEIETQPLRVLFFNELVHPFFLFQIWSVILWLLERYEFYAIMILITSLGSALLEAKEIYSNQQRLARLAAITSDVLVERGENGGAVRVSSEQLVPGDVIILEQGMDLMCDVTLVSGSLLVNEASLTGEACPVRKSAWSPPITEAHSDNDDSDHGGNRSDDEYEDYDDEFAEGTGAALVSFDQTYDEGDFFAVEGLTPMISSTAPETKSHEDTWSKSEHMGFAGTWIVEARDNPRGLVVRTGAATVRGELVRDIIVGGKDKLTSNENHMQRQAYVVVLCLLVVGVTMSVITIRHFRKHFHMHGLEPILDGLDLLTIAVPPALPATITFGLVFALSRLEKKRILCVEAACVARAAWLQVLCFDKTGTLTDLGLDVRSLRLATPRPPASAPTEPTPQAQVGAGSTKRKRHAEFSEPFVDFAARTWPCEVERVLATCHSLAWVDNEIVGDEVDVRLFELSRWTLQTSATMQGGDGYVRGIDNASGPTVIGNGGVKAKANAEVHDAKQQLTDESSRGIGVKQANTKKPRFVFRVFDEERNEQIHVLRLLDFDPELARMGVVAQISPLRGKDQNGAPETGKSFVFVKGAPEIVAMKCVRSSVPANLHKVLTEYAQQGLRILAIAARELQQDRDFVPGSSGGGKLKLPDVRRVPRARLERDLKFLGLVVLENRLKSDTTPVLRDLRESGDLRCVMVTGDHSRTAISVAKQCGILNTRHRVIVADVQAGKSSSNSSGAHTHSNVIFVDAQSNTKWTRKQLLEALGFQVGLLPEQSIVRVASPTVQVAVTGAAFRRLAEEYTVLSSRKQQLLQQQRSDTGVSEVDKKMLPFRAVLEHGAVFARMSANDKASLVRLLRAEVCTEVGMCGDGANDAAALKEAMVGVSLCEGIDADATASLAAPLTSRVASIQAMRETILEGRAAADASLGAFAFMFLYSLIQLYAVALLYQVGSTFGDGQFLYVDLILIIPLGILVGKLSCAPRLTHIKPPVALSERRVLVSVFGQAAIMLIFQVGTVALVHWNGLDTDLAGVQAVIEKKNSPMVMLVENTSLFLVTNFQYILACVVFNLGPPYRQRFSENRAFLWLVSVLTLACLLLVVLSVGENRYVGMHSLIGRWLELDYLSVGFRAQLLCVIALNGVSSVLWKRAFG